MAIGRFTGHLGCRFEKYCQVFFLLFPDAKSVKENLKEQIADKLWSLWSLGLQWKRAQLIIHLSESYLKGDWTHVTQLPGISKQAGTGETQDHKLVEYWKEVGEMLCRKS